jgi:hypothetical protein
VLKLFDAENVVPVVEDEALGSRLLKSEESGTDQVLLLQVFVIFHFGKLEYLLHAFAKLPVFIGFELILVAGDQFVDYWLAAGSGFATVALAKEFVYEIFE